MLLDETCSRVDRDGALASAGLDMLLRPSSASLNSVTPTALADRAKLCKDMLSCIRAGDIFKRGETPSPRMDCSKTDVLSNAMDNN